MAHDTPVLIYAPGLGHVQENTADAVADVLARTMDRVTPGKAFGTKTDPEVSAPRGLKVGKTIVDGDGNGVLQLFELDYLPAFEETSVTGPPVVPGVVQSAAYAVLGGAKWWAALGRRAKTARTKVQLLVGFVAAGALIFAALVAVYSALIAAGVAVPGSGVFGETAAAWTFGITAIGLVVTWAAIRKWVLGLAATTQHLIKFVRNDDTVADTVSIVLDDAIDGLRQNEWTGNIHLLGYCFGSLTLYEAMFPKKQSLRATAPADAVSSLTTIGCPLDMVRLYAPEYVKDRCERHPQLPWKNVFNPADIFASNLKNNNDVGSGEGRAVGTKTVHPDSMSYLDEKLGLFRIFTSGRTHASYWGSPERANCFEPLLVNWK